MIRVVLIYSWQIEVRGKQKQCPLPVYGGGIQEVNMTNAEIQDRLNALGRKLKADHKELRRITKRMVREINPKHRKKRRL